MTHGRIDHVGGVLKLRRLTGAPVFLNEADLPQLDMMEEQAGWLGIRAPETAPPDEGPGSREISISSDLSCRVWLRRRVHNSPK